MAEPAEAEGSASAGAPERSRPESAAVMALVRRVVAFDDHDAFAEIVGLFQSPVRQFLRRLCAGDPSAADDLAQEAFFKAYRHLASFAGRGRLLSWLFRIAYQQFAERERRRPRFATVALAEADLASDDAGRAYLSRRTFDQLLAELAPVERAALLLHYRHELTHPEVAAALELPLGTVKSTIRRARRKLQESQNPGQGGPPS